MAGQNELRHEAIGMWGVIFYSISIVSPAFTFTVGSVAAIVYSGKVAPLVFLIAGISTFSAVIALYIFSRYVSNSGGYFKFVEAATQNLYISKSVGLWYLSSIIGVMIMGGAIVAWFVSSALNILFNITVPLYEAITLSFVVPVLYLIVGYFSIKSAARTAITIGLLQLIVFTAFAIAFVIKTPYNSDLYFNIGNSVNGLHGFFLAMILGAFFSYGGYGSVVALGEEVKFSRKTMKRAIVYALLVMVVFETFAVYSIVAAAGPRIAVLNNSIAPSLYLSKLYFGADAGFIIFIIGLLGIIFSFVLSGNNGARSAFALARDGLLPSSLTQVHRRYNSPYIAVFWTFVISVIGMTLTETLMVTLFGESNGLFYSWAIWGTVIMIFSLLLSIVTNSTLAFFIHRIKKKINVLTHIALPSISSVITAIAMYYSLSDLKSPMSAVYVIALFLIVVDLMIIYNRRSKTKVDRLDDLISN